MPCHYLACYIYETELLSTRRVIKRIRVYPYFPYRAIGGWLL